MRARKRQFRRHSLAALCLAAGLVPAVAACGPTAEQASARESAAVSEPPAPAPEPKQARVPAAEPEPPAAPEPMKVTVSGAQAGMAQEVQDACQPLLREDPGPVPGNEAADCVAAAMVAGSGASQTVSTSASWLPPGTYTMDFRTGETFEMQLDSADGELGISVGGGSRTLRTGDARVAADASGGPEESYAAVLVDAAELTANPQRLGGLVESGTAAAVEYRVDYQGVQATRLTAVVEPKNPGDFSGSIVLTLDELYRPLLIEYAGTTRGISTSIRAEITGWGSSGPLR